MATVWASAFGGAYNRPSSQPGCADLRTIRPGARASNSRPKGAYVCGEPEPAMNRRVRYGIVPGLALRLACATCLLPVGGCDRSAPFGTSTQPTPARRSEPATKRPTVVVVLFDTLRADRLGVYGHQADLTPTMDAVAARGVVFEQAIAPAPWTLPSVSSLFTGLYPDAHGANQYLWVRRRGRLVGKISRLAGRFETLAERLRRAGYQTAAFVANPFIIPRNGFKQGFDHYDASFVGNDTPGAVVNQAVFDWLDQRRDQRPLFLYVHYMDTHAPYVADAPLVAEQIRRLRRRPASSLRRLTETEKRDRASYFHKNMLHYARDPQHRALFDYAEYWAARYDACVRQADRNLAALIEQLRRRGLWDDALVVLVADHGEALGEHFKWGHGTHAWQNQLHVPLILRWPAHLPSGRRVTATVRLIDVLPTLLRLLELHTGATMQGVDLMPWITGQRADPLPALSEAVKKQPGLKTMIRGPWKLFAWPEPQLHYALYNLRDDPGETRDLAADEPQRVRELAELLKRQVAENQRLAAGTRAEHAEASEAEVRRLQALGYTGDTSPGEPATRPATRPAHRP